MTNNNNTGIFSTTGTTINTTGIGITSGSITISPGSTGNPQSSPNVFNNVYYPNGNYSISTMPAPKYRVMDLPRDELPIKVFVKGEMLTLGFLGTKVECAYVGKQLVFEPDIIPQAGLIYVGRSRVTISVEYNDAIYHYNVECLDDSRTLDCTLVSTVKKQCVCGSCKK